jgi:hypothetical protein
MATLVIRDAQDAALKRAAFVRWTKGHLQKFFPGHVQALGPAGTDDAIAHGIRRAEGYGITADADVCQYIDLMFCFGRDFDRDPALPWAAAILGEAPSASPEPKIDRLHQASMRYLREVISAGDASGPAPGAG